MTAAESAQPLPYEAEHLRERAISMIRLRWVVIGAIVVVCVVAAHVGVIDTLPQMLVVDGAMAGLNALVGWWLGAHPRATTPQLRRAVLAQLLVDVAGLSALLHYSDSVENPFVMLFSFPVASGATLLPARMAFPLAGCGVVLHGSMIVGEYAGVLTHHAFAGDRPSGMADPMFQSDAILVGYLGAFAILLFGVTYSVESVARRLRDAQARWRDSVRVAASRERLVRVGQVAAGVAHSVRNPLHGLVNALDLISRRVDDQPSTARTLTLMEEGLRRIETVTQRLLSLSRDAPPLRRPTDIDELVRETANLLVSRRAGERRVVIHERLGGVGVAEVDPDQVSEALANVLDNAVQACAQQGAVTVATHAGDGDRVVVTVTDDGAGIASEHVPHLFDPFFTTKAVGSGTGLGLPIARRIVEEHGGTIALSSDPGTGTHVTIEIPRAGRPSEESRHG